MSNPLHHKDTKEERPPIPLPDPDQVRHTFDVAMAKVRERQGFYIGVAAAILILAMAAIYLMTRSPSAPPQQFAELWKRSETVRRKLLTNQSATKEIADIEAYLGQIRGTEVEGEALWLLGIYHYRQAWTGDNTTPDERKEHLQKAIGYLKELDQAKFDEFLLAKPNWFASGPAPTATLMKQIKADLEWVEGNAYTEPMPAAGTVAVLRTSDGDVHIQFFPELAPEHVKNFVTLARKGTYNETLFHFARKSDAETTVGVMGGDPYTFFYNDPLNKKHILRWGTGGVGYDLAPEQARYRVHHCAGVVTSQMPPDADWDNGVQFMLMTGTDTDLDKSHTPFAKVVEGQAVVDKLANKKTAGQHLTFKDDPDFSTIATRDLIVEPAVLHKVVIYENGKALEHDFPLTDPEKSLSTLKGNPVQPLTGDAVYCGRKMRTPDASEKIRDGLDVPFPDDVSDPAKANPLGDRISRSK